MTVTVGSSRKLFTAFSRAAILMLPSSRRYLYPSFFSGTSKMSSIEVHWLKMTTFSVVGAQDIMLGFGGGGGRGLRAAAMARSEPLEGVRDIFILLFEGCILFRSAPSRVITWRSFAEDTQSFWLTCRPALAPGSNCRADSVKMSRTETSSLHAGHGCFTSSDGPSPPAPQCSETHWRQSRCPHLVTTGSSTRSKHTGHSARPSRTSSRSSAR